MTRVFALLFAALLALLALAGGFFVPLRVVAASPASIAGTFAFDGLARSYRLFRPAALGRARPVPLVVVLHGGFGTGLQAERSYGWDDAATRNEFVVLYPDGIQRAWNAGNCCGAPQRRNVDDVGFLSALVEQIARDQNVDRERIFITGMSNGAMMAYRMACESPLAIAAIGPVAGTLAVPCERARPTSLLAIHGLADDRVPFAGGIPQKSFSPGPRLAVPAAIARWNAIDACTRSVSRSQGSVTYTQASCARGRTVELVTIAGAGHQWPGGAPPPAWAKALLQLDEPSTALDATALLWSFFATHPS
ncbi:MAG TPA: PHB depolymerase family esterase [Candidatus Baltobacteraceae bacterium]|nr:PHB depolymerase family esterase [Candidatus Baltobacteraceae bacterium]